MEAIVRKVDAGIFRSLLDFTHACGCTSFTIRNYQSEDAVGISELPSAVYRTLLPFLAERQCGPPAYIFTAALNSDSIRTLESIISAGPACQLTLNVGNRRIDGYAPKMLAMRLPPQSARISLSDFEAEALFRHGIEFDFRCSDHDTWERFKSEHMVINAPAELSLRSDDFDLERWSEAGISSQRELRRQANDPHLEWWTREHDALIIREIDRHHWAWRPPWEEIVRITPPSIIENFKANHPACRRWVWYNVLRYFAYARALAIGLTDEMKLKAAWVRCLLCDRVLHQTKSYFFTSPEQSFFCYPCVREHWWSAESDLVPNEIRQHVRELADSIQRVPHQNFGKSRSDLEGLSAEQIAAVLRAMKRKPSRRSIKEHFGTWFHALVSAGVLPSGSQQMERGLRSVAQDGHLCRSLGERTICDLLSQYGIEHEREAPYPGERSFRSDWRVGAVFIEYLGLSGDPVYDQKAKEKEAILRSYGLELIKVYPRDLSSRATLLRKLKPILPQKDAIEGDQMFNK